MAAARELVIADEPAAWEALGFETVQGRVVALGGLSVRLVGRRAGRGIVELRIEGLRGERPDGLPIVPGSPGATSSSGHPNGALAIDHVVVLTDDRDRTVAALVDAGGNLRRQGEPPELPAPMAFVRFEELIVEVAQAGGPARFWGLTVTVADLDALAGPLLGAARPAVQPGRRIATVGGEAGLSVALAFMSRAQDSNPRAASG